ncbi:MAG: cytochrome P450 [Anaerolineales bacterium]|jgi:sterol 14-demethylase
MPKPTPPEVPGLPLLGNALEFRRDANNLFNRGYQQHGSIFTIHLGPRPAAVVVGPEHNRFVLEQTDKKFTMQEGYRFLIPMFGEQVFFVAGHEEYIEQKRIMLPAFRGRMMSSYVEVMQTETERWLETLGDDGEFDLVSSFERLTMYIAAAALLGEDFRERLGDRFADLYRDLAAGIEYLLPTNLPLPRFIRRDRARAKLEAMVKETIAERRADPDKHDDFLQVFIDSTYSDGSPAPDSVITALVMGLVFAGHETTAGHGSWAMVHLLQNPEYLKRVVSDLDGVWPAEDTLSLSKLREFESLEWALKETERLQPVAEMLIRTTTEPVEMNGYEIPEGWIVFLTPHVSHRLPELFENPEFYDPLRFSPGREEDRQDPYALVGFGGGPHKCLGMNFAYTEMKVIFSLLLHEYELELLNPTPKVVRDAGTARPERPCLIRYKRRG